MLHAIPPARAGACKRSSTRLTAQFGASLLEVLVALLLVSLGMLGIAGLAGSTLSYNKASQFRLTGLALVNNFADHARLNIYGYDLGKYDIAMDETAPATVTLVLTETIPLTAATNLAQFDKKLFMEIVGKQLPGGQAVVVTNKTGEARGMDIWLVWKEAQTTATDELLVAGQQNCPTSFTAANLKEYTCMYFKVGV